MVVTQVPFRASIPVVLQKVLHVSDERGVYITLEASDTGVDLQRDRMDFRVLEKFAEQARQGKVKLRRSHSDPFYIASSVDGKVVQTPDGRFVLTVTFKAEDTGAGYYPEILHLIKMFKEQGSIPMQASVGGWITGYETILEKGEIVRIIKDAEIEHVALTPPDGAVNPRTRVVEVLVKAFVDAITQYEQMHKTTPTVTVNIINESKEENKKMETTVDVRRLMKELERCAIERRRMFYTKQDVKALYDRVKKHGISPSPLGNIVKPEVYLDHDEFADPVNYLFPLAKSYIEAGIEFARQHPNMFFSLYDTASAAKVYTNLVKAALDNDIPVKFAAAPVDALLPEEIATKLDGFNADVYNLLKSWAEATQDYYINIVSGLYDETVEEGNISHLIGELERRSQKFGYPPAPNAKLKPHKFFANLSLSKFADPVGYNFPITPEWVLWSYRAFRYTPVRNLYNPEAQRFIYSRILKGLENIGALIPYEPEFELNKHFAKRPVFVGVDEDDAEKVFAKAKTVRDTPIFATQSAVIYAYYTHAHTEEELRKGDAVVTAADAPKFPFVIGAKFSPKKEHIGYVRVHPSLVKIDPKEHKTEEIPGLAVLVGTKLVQTLGLDKLQELTPEEVKLRWVGPKEGQTPIAVLPDRKPHDARKVATPDDAGVKIIGGLQALRKGKVIAEWFVDTMGNVYEINYIGWGTPVLLTKGKEHIMDIGNCVEEELRRAGLAPRDMQVYISQVGTRFAVWGYGGETFITPIKINDDGSVKIYPVKIPAIHAYIPDPEYDEDAASALIGSFVMAVAKELGEDHEWVRETIEELGISEEEEAVESSAAKETPPVTIVEEEGGEEDLEETEGGEESEEPMESAADYDTENEELQSLYEGRENENGGEEEGILFVVGDEEEEL